MTRTMNPVWTLSRRKGIVCLCALLCIVFSLPSTAEDWTGFRGSDSSGQADASGLPSTWDSTRNIVWKTELPGLGASSPITLASRVYVTCYSGYAESKDNPGAMKNLIRHVVCLDRDSGAILWAKEFKAKMPESEYKGGNSTWHGYASSTPTTDGERLYVFFGLSGVYALDLDGNVLWNTGVGAGTHGWGSGTSPLLYKNLVIVNASVESESLVAMNKETGEIVWKASGIRRCWSSPILAMADGKQELVLNAPKKLVGFDPVTGKELWHCDGIPDSYVCPTAIVEDGIIYANGGRKNTTIAVRAGGRGNVTGTHLLWKVSKGSNVSSLVYSDKHLYWFHESRGIVYCLNAETGDMAYEERLNPKPGILYSSATAADGKLFTVSQYKGAFVLAAKPQFQLLAVNQFQDDPSRANASIVVSNNQLIMRTDKAIYCIGK